MLTLMPLDGNALAAALSVKEQYGAELSLITMGPPAAEAALRECLAAGADRAILVTDRAFGNADTLATSYSIVSAAKSIDSFDLIFCGKETLDGATGQMGAQLAERFGAAQVTSASLIKSVDEAAGKLVVERELETGVEDVYKRQAQKICEKAMQLCGGMGLLKDFGLSRYYEDARVLTIGEGTSEIQKNIIFKSIMADR